MARAIYSKPKPANAPRPALAPRTNLPPATEAPQHVAAKAPRHIPTKTSRTIPTKRSRSNTANRVFKAPRKRAAVPTKAPRDIGLHLALRAANEHGKPVPTKAPRNPELHLKLRAAKGYGKVPTKYHGMVKMPAPRRNPVRGVRKIQQVRESEEPEESEEESLGTFYELFNAETEVESDTASEDSAMEDVEEEQQEVQTPVQVRASVFQPDSEDVFGLGRTHFLNQLQEFRDKSWTRSLEAEEVWRGLMEEADKRDAWEPCENMVVFWIGGYDGHA
ncbi:hypothetical protein BZA77DRAFT_386831 [Pyronema omphalodes]|nr:hypothetical protein BZA77DRAFT_386831 [Pyronema omphalodes]